MRVPIIEMTGPTWAKLATTMSCIPYSYGYWPHSGRYVPDDFKYGEYRNPVQLSEAIEVCSEMTMHESYTTGDVAVIHVLPSMHDFFWPLPCGLYWKFYWFDTIVNDSRREKRNKIAYETHIRKMQAYKNSCLWCIDQHEYLLIDATPCACGCVCSKLTSYGLDIYDEDIPF